jgi:hypothetical protein
VHKLEGIVALQGVLKFYGFAAQTEQAGGRARDQVVAFSGSQGI